MLKRIALAVLFAGSLQAQTVAPSSMLKFEAASIKPATGIANCWSHDPGRYTCKATLNMLIASAFELRAYQSPFPAEHLSMAVPTWDVVASVPPETAKKWGVSPEANYHELMAMLRNLLIERFKLKYHYEKKEVQGYSLTVDKSGFKPKADATSKPLNAPKDYVQAPGTVSYRWHVPAETWMDASHASIQKFADELSDSNLQRGPNPGRDRIKRRLHLQSAF
jgi:uncharacterized protein (TIGR03435 family)